MISVESLRLEPSMVLEKRLAGEIIRLSAIPSERGLPLDVLINVFGLDHSYSRFGQCVVGSRQGSFGARIEIAMQTEQEAFAALVGLHRVIFINPSSRRLHEVLQLYPQETDDQKGVGPAEPQILN